jgi:signal transduction histidine kinase
MGLQWRKGPERSRLTDEARPNHPFWNGVATNWVGPRTRLWLSRIADERPLMDVSWVQRVRATLTQLARTHAGAAGEGGSDSADSSLARSRRAALVVSLCMLALSAAILGLHVTRPSDGVQVSFWPNAWPQDGFRVGWVVPPSAVRPGDVVVAVDGRSMESWARALFEGGAAAPRWHDGEQLTYTVVRDGRHIDVHVTLGAYPLGWIFRNGGWLYLVDVVPLALIASYIFVRRPRERLTAPLLLFAAGGLALNTETQTLGVLDVTSPETFWLYIILNASVLSLGLSAALHFALTFPRPHALTTQRRWLIPAVYAAPFCLMLIYLGWTRLATSSTLGWNGMWHILVLLIATWAVLVIIALLAVYRSSRQVADRQKIRWVVFACVLILVGDLVLIYVPTLLTNRPLLGSDINQTIQGLLFLSLPAALAIAILRYRLFDIDIIINRTLVYGSLTAIIIGMYVLVVGVLGALFQSRGNLLISLLATGLIAVAFAPLRAWLQSTVNRLLFGWRDDPYAVLTRLGQRLETSLAPEAVLLTIAEAVANALLLPYVAIAVRRQSALQVAAAHGTAMETPVHFPLIYQAEHVGELLIAPRSPRESFTANDRRLLANLAHQAGIAVHAVGLAEDLQALTADLQRSREHLVTAREEERRRLRRDLHDGLGPSLAALVLKAGSARALYPSDPKVADALLLGLEADLNSVIGEIRRLVYNLRPPALDDLGLVEAIRACSAEYGGRATMAVAKVSSALSITVESPASLPPLPAAVEVAAYRIAQEALMNVTRHAQATNCMVRLSLHDSLLKVEIQDDGVGIGTERQAGVGLASMRERAAELGGTCLIEANPAGGTWVLARLPLLPVPPESQPRHESDKS